MSMNGYILKYLLDGITGYIIWVSNEHDMVLLEEDGTVRSFRTSRQAYEYALRRSVEIKIEEPTLHDLDLIRRWLANTRSSRVDCGQFLSAWNLFHDTMVALDREPKYLTEHYADRIYQKLFWGSNLPSVTPPKKRYIPLWSGRELNAMKRILGDGLSLFRSVVRPGLVPYHQSDRG